MTDETAREHDEWSCPECLGQWHDGTYRLGQEVPCPECESLLEVVRHAWTGRLFLEFAE